MVGWGGWFGNCCGGSRFTIVIGFNWIGDLTEEVTDTVGVIGTIGVIVIGTITIGPIGSGDGAIGDAIISVGIGDIGDIGAIGVITNPVTDGPGNTSSGDPNTWAVVVIAGRTGN